MWLWIAGILLGLPLLAVGLLFWLYLYLRLNYAQYLVRIFKERPLFIIPRGQPVPGAEDVRLTTEDGLELRGCYLKTSASQRQGVVLFGLEFGSNRWSCVPYCEHLLSGGFDVFTFEFRNQGESQAQPDYEPLQWLTEHEEKDMEAAVAYLKGRSDADPRGVGFFGISKGGGAGLLAGARDPYVRCFVTDGVFATFTTVVPYIRKWILIYNKQYWLRWLQFLVPSWYYEMAGRACLGRCLRERHYPDLERVMAKLSPRPLLMIHGGADTYIKPEMARSLFDRARQPKEFWLVDGAKHNQALHVAGPEYHRRVREFFQVHLAGPTANEEALRNGDAKEALPRNGDAKKANHLATSPCLSATTPPLST